MTSYYNKQTFFHRLPDELRRLRSMMPEGDNHERKRYDHIRNELTKVSSVLSQYAAELNRHGVFTEVNESTTDCMMTIKFGDKSCVGLHFIFSSGKLLYERFDGEPSGDKNLYRCLMTKPNSFLADLEKIVTYFCQQALETATDREWFFHDQTKPLAASPFAK